MHRARASLRCKAALEAAEAAAAVAAETPAEATDLPGTE